MNCHTSDGKPKCEDKYCSVEKGKKIVCITKTKAGIPWKSKLNTELGKTYYYNEKYGLVGSKKDVKDYIKKFHKKFPKKHGKSKDKVSKKSKDKVSKKSKKSPKKKIEEKKQKIKKKMSKMSIIIQENLKENTVPVLKKMLEDLKVPKKDIPIKKMDIILKIIDVQSRQSTKSSIKIKKPKKEIIISPEKKIVISPKKEKIKKSVTFAVDLEQIIGSPKKKKVQHIPEEIEIEIKSGGKSFIKRGKRKLLYKSKSNKKENKKSCTDESSKSCDKKICNILTGNCITNNIKNTREKYILDSNDKKFVGNNEEITKLQRTIGGDITFIGTDILEKSGKGYPSKKNKINIQERISELVGKSEEKESVAALTKKLKKLTDKKSPVKKSPVKKSPPKKKVKSSPKTISIKDPRKIMLDFEL